MIWLWLQALMILGLAFGIGLLIGDYLGRMALTQHQESASPRAEKAHNIILEQDRVPADYHGYEPEITPLLSPKTVDTITPQALKPATEQVASQGVATKPNLYFPISSFGVMSETHNRQDPIISPLANLDRQALEAALAHVSKAQEPTRLFGAQAAKDDLKLIDGIGPVNEEELNALGIYYFWQMAAWSAEEVVWVAQHIHFPDRIVRENWIKQAANLLLKGDIEQNHP